MPNAARKPVGKSSGYETGVIGSGRGTDKLSGWVVWDVGGQTFCQKTR